MACINEILEAEAKANQRKLDERNREIWERILNETDQTSGEAFFQEVLRWCEGELTLDKYDMLQATCALPDFTNSSWHRGTQEFYIKQVVERLKAVVGVTAKFVTRWLNCGISQRQKSAVI